MTLPARAPGQALAFYRETLGVPAPVSFRPGAAAVHHVAFHAEDLAAQREAIEPRVEVLADGREFDFADWGGARAFYFRDAAGNVAELIARPKAWPSWRLAEVGLPVDDVAGAVASLRQQLDLPLYDEAGDEFAALGDDEGLLIVVRAGRGWVPTGEPSSLVGVVVEVEGAPAEIELGPHRVVARPEGPPRARP